MYYLKPSKFYENFKLLNIRDFFNNEYILYLMSAIFS